MILTPCLTCGAAVARTYRGRCERHRSEACRGYGQDWRRVRAQVRREVKACEACGSTADLAVDHIRPQSLGGTHERANLRVLCRACHARIGAKLTYWSVR